MDRLAFEYQVCFFYIFHIFCDMFLPHKNMRINNIVQFIQIDLHIFLAHIHCINLPH